MTQYIVQKNRDINKGEHMGLGSCLESNFNNLLNNCKCSGINEVCLFNTLKVSFEQLNSQFYRAKVIHSNAKSGTTFDMEDSFLSFNPKNKPSNNGYFNDITTELADLLLVTYSPKRHTAKITFMQNKYERQYKYDDKFYLNVLQLYLLKCKPYIKRSKIPFVRGNFLNSAKLPSICSYGVFYKGNNSYNMNYYRADLIDINGAPYKTDSKKLPFNGGINFLEKINNELDLQGCHGLMDFGNALEDFYVGSPISYRQKKILCKSFPDAPKDFVEMEVLAEDNDEYYSDNILSKNNINVVFVCVDKQNDKREDLMK